MRHDARVDPVRLALLGLAAAVAAIINSIAGGGSLVSFPALLAAGVPPVLASATNTAALTPGGIASAIAYRSELGPRARLSFALAAVSSLGGVAGAVLLLSAPPRAFELVVPWLVLAATLLLLFQERLTPKETSGAERPRTKLLVALGLTSIAVYGGYFGAGIGMLTLALLAALGSASLHRMNAMKSVIVASINGAATLYFLAMGRVELVPALVMAAGAIAGGYTGAAVARRVNPRRVRWVVVAIGVGLSGLLAVRYY
ncbi:MAG: UPF0721 transmembrane protein [Polyangiaceae bacterium]